MLSQDHFYWNMTRKYIVAFAYIFSDVHIQRVDESGTLQKDIKVPITYAGKKKIYQVLQRNSTLKNKVSVVLPRISFLITSLAPDSQRKTNNLNEIDIENDGITHKFLYSPVPYDFNIDLIAWAKNMDDLLQITEQIAVFFKPGYSIEVKEIPALNLQRKINIILNDVSLDIETDLDQETDRTVMANFGFTLKGYLYPPLTEVDVIEIINTKIAEYDNEDHAYANIEQIYSELTQEITETIEEEPDFTSWPD